MKTGFLSPLLSVVLFVTGVRAADTFDETMERAVLEYAKRLRTASDELTQTRERIAGEKAPLLKAMRAAEDRIIAAEQETTRLDTAQNQLLENRRRLARDAETLRKNESYVNTLAHDGLKAFSNGLAPGEGQLLSEQIQAFQQALEDPAQSEGGKTAEDVAEFLRQRVHQSLGGYTAAGSALVGEDNQVVKGTFAFVGPETYFRMDQSGAAGTVRAREGESLPVVYVLSAWEPAAAEAFFEGKPGTVMADASAGKALRLSETKGTIWQHIRKGGVVAYAILGVGLIAAGMILLKIRDLVKMGVDTPAVVEGFLATVANGARPEAHQTLRALRASTRELFDTGLRHLDQPKAILEEHLYAVVLRHRLHSERWLPLLAVIATAAPLMGLLGTVTGLVRTFALITVFGTGNAGKLASGISEVLVATELGLLVAIPTLVAHGLLSHRIQKNLSLLERYALQFVTAARSERIPAPEKESLPT
ncbi:MAG: MotA/TolQ/ExbB proton channel family protein [Opitutaceae bacterium]|nr:MotA/TolQ/ExbB proton channel family protein [Opitutaceae bacterium]